MKNLVSLARLVLLFLRGETSSHMLLFCMKIKIFGLRFLSGQLKRAQVQVLSKIPSTICGERS